MNQTRALLILLGVNFIWGTTYVIAKVALETLPPALLVSLRFVVAALVLWSILLIQASRRPAGEPHPLAIDPADRWQAIKLGVLAFALGYLFSYFGINLTTATEASLMIIGEAIFTTLLTAFFVGERIGRWRSIGIVLGAIGVAVLVLSNITDLGDDSNGWLRAVGNVLVLCGIFCEALYTVLGGELSKRIPPLTMVAYAYGSSLLLWLPILGWYLLNGNFPTITPAAGLGVLYLGIFPSVICFIIWFSVIRHTGASLGAISLFLQPLVGSLLGIFLMGDRVTFGLLIGGGLIFIALYLTTLPDRSTLPLSKEASL